MAFTHPFMNHSQPAPPGALEAAVLAALDARGLLSSAELQVAVGKSQPTLSRALQRLGSDVVAFGQGRSTRYGRLAPILGLPARQPLWWTDAAGRTERWGTLSLLGGQRVLVEAVSGRQWLAERGLPWFLAPLRLQGFLGRLCARSPALQHLGDDPERWSIEQQLFAVLRQVHDAPGALTLGDITGELVPDAPAETGARAAHYDSLAADIARGLPAHSSAGGEQPKFLTALASPTDPLDVAWLIVKFSPPRSTPYGERWHDLLHAEALALATLAEAGEPVARCRAIESPTRTYLESLRFDRVGLAGRRHVVALDAVHEAFVGGPLQHWAATADALAAQRRLSADDAARVRLWRAFGRLIGNTDMHFGNLSLWCDDPAAGRFALAPCYDMLPMAYKPDAHRDALGLMPLPEIHPTLSEAGAWPQASQLALKFWQRVAVHASISTPFRGVAAENARRIAAA